MQHFSCDACQQPIGDLRYEVVVEVAAVSPQPVPALTADDLTDDNLQALADQLAAEQEAGLDFDEPPARSSHRYDLCPACHARYACDPLGTRLWGHRLQFSTN